MLAGRRREFRNWAGNQVCLPSAKLAPASAAEVETAVAEAVRNGSRVKVVGAGHSFTDIACTNGALLQLDALDGFEVLSDERVRVGGGIRLFDLNERLASVGLAMPNLGDIAYQSISGAIATATHGTGLTKGNLATTVVGMELVNGLGERISLNADQLRLARVGLGALGVVTQVELQCVPAFNLHVRETVENLDEVLDGFADEITSNDHFEFFWLPGTRRCQVKRNNQTTDAAAPPSRFEYFRDKIVGENIAFDIVNRVNRRLPSATPTVAKAISAAASEREFVDRSDKVFASPRHVKFYEMEYGIPVEALPEAFRRVRSFMKQLALANVFPIECRVSAADDIALSTGYGRTSAWIACHVYQGTSYDAYFQGVDAIMRDYDGRPHWGKLHFQDAASLGPLYPKWDDFRELRAQLDPLSTFANNYLDRVLGPVVE